MASDDGSRATAYEVLRVQSHLSEELTPLVRVLCGGSSVPFLCWPVRSVSYRSRRPGHTPELAEGRVTGEGAACFVFRTATPRGRHLLRSFLQYHLETLPEAGGIGSRPALMDRRQSRAPDPASRRGGLLHTLKTKEADVPVLNHVVLAFKLDLPLGPHGRFAARGDQVVVLDDLHADETSLKCRYALSPLLQEPGPLPEIVQARTSSSPHRIEGHQAQCVIRCGDHADPAPMSLPPALPDTVSLLGVPDRHDLTARSCTTRQRRSYPYAHRPSSRSRPRCMPKGRGEGQTARDSESTATPAASKALPTENDPSSSVFRHLSKRSSLPVLPGVCPPRFSFPFAQAAFPTTPSQARSTSVSKIGPITHRIGQTLSRGRRPGLRNARIDYTKKITSTAASSQCRLSATPVRCPDTAQGASQRTASSQGVLFSAIRSTLGPGPTRPPSFVSLPSHRSPHITPRQQGEQRLSYLIEQSPKSPLHNQFPLDGEAPLHVSHRQGTK